MRMKASTFALLAAVAGMAVEAAPFEPIKRGRVDRIPADSDRALNRAAMKRRRKANAAMNRERKRIYNRGLGGSVLA